MALNRGALVVRLAVLPAQLLSLVAALPLMAAPFILAWTALVRLRHGRWPPASVADAAHGMRWPSPPGSEHVPVWLALGVVGFLGLKLCDALAILSLKAVEAWVDGRRLPPAPEPPRGS